MSPRTRAASKLRIALAPLTVLLSVSFAQAQVAPDAGSILRQQLPPRNELPSKRPPPLRTEEPARAPLKAASDVQFVLKGLRITGQTAFSENELLELLLPPLIGKQVGLTDLEDAAARISHHYRSNGYLVARAYLPAQDIRAGVVEIAVLEGRIGRVVIENESRVRDEVIAARVANLEGQLVREDKIDSTLRLTYDLTGVGSGSQAALRPGLDVGEADLVLNLTPDPFLSGSIGVDNHGNRFTGGNRLTGHIAIHSPTGSGDKLLLRGTWGDPDLGVYEASYQVPLSATGLQVGVDYSHVNYELGRNFSPLEAKGKADTWLAFAAHPIVLAHDYSAHAQVSYQQSDIQDRIDATSTVTDKSSRLGTFTLTGDWIDEFGSGGVTAVSLSYGLGELDIESPVARAIDGATARTQGNFQKWGLTVTRLQRLADRTSLFLFIAGQKASKNLDSSEKLILGGPNGVKAYPVGEAPGDSGYLVSAELRYDVNAGWIPGQAQLLVFADTGKVTVNENPFAPGPNNRSLSSIGVGVNLATDLGFEVRASAAHKLGSERATSDTDEPTRAWLQLVKRF